MRLVVRTEKAVFHLPVPLFQKSAAAADAYDACTELARFAQGAEAAPRTPLFWVDIERLQKRRRSIADDPTALMLCEPKAKQRHER